MKVVVIGATGTIGHAVADALAERHEVVRASRKGDASVDVFDARSVGALFDRVTDMDAVVLAAATLPGANGTIDQLGEAQLALVPAALLAQVRLVQMAMTRLRDGGSITLTSGDLATKPSPGASLLTLHAAGIEGFVRAAALEVPRGLRINAVSPVFVRETMEKRGLDGRSGMPAKTLAASYVKAVEGTMNGAILDPTA